MKYLRHLQIVVLNIAKDIDKLCRENGIEYYLGGGGAIGAIRHRGYIPWDDDLDFLMTYDNYKRFTTVCKEKLSQEKYLIEENCNGLPCLKIRLVGTTIKEKGKSDGPYNQIFLDVFRLEKAPDSVWQQKKQYFFSKIWVAYMLGKHGYKPSTKFKQGLMILSKLLYLPFVKCYVRRAIFKYNQGMSDNVYACLWGTTRFANSFTRKEIYGKPFYVQFEDTQLPVPEQYDEYLTQFFGNYMQLPPMEKRITPHIMTVDFGKY